MPRTSTPLVLALIVIAFAPACFETRGSAWMREPLLPDDPPTAGPAPGASNRPSRAPRTASAAGNGGSDEENPPDDQSSHASSGRSLGVFHNTYYSFPDATDYSGEQVQIFDASCKPIASVPKQFHDKLCIQGSGRIAGGKTVSFAKRGCTCALVCPRSSQQICYEALDPARFPWGRGATGGPITPFRTIAVDTSLIALGTRVFIPAFVGIAIPGGGTHDGCFIAQDRGLKVTGRSVDVYTGSEISTAAWNKQVETGTGLDVFVDEPRCAATAPVRGN